MNLRYEAHKLVCSTCGKKILVEIHLIGVSHNASVSASCAECIGEPSPKFVADHPNEAKAIVE